MSPIVVTKRILLGLTICHLTGCVQKVGEWQHPNQSGSASLIVEIENYGGGMGFNREYVSLQVGTTRKDRIITFKQMSGVSVTWKNEHEAIFCYNGSIESGEKVWSQNISGSNYVIIFDDTCGTSMDADVKTIDTSL